MVFWDKVLYSSKAWWWEQEAADHTASLVKNQAEVSARIQLNVSPFPFTQ